MKSLFAIAAFIALGASLASAPAQARTMSSMMMPTCAAGDKVVWVNTRSHVFYEPGASHYGKTKHGKYMCQSRAMALRMRMAKGGMMPDSNGSMMNGQSGMMKRHKRMNGSMGSGSMMSPGSMMKPATMASPMMAPGKMTAPNAMMSPAPTTAPLGSRVTPAPITTASPSN